MLGGTRIENCLGKEWMLGEHELMLGGTRIDAWRETN